MSECFLLANYKLIKLLLSLLFMLSKATVVIFKTDNPKIQASLEEG